MSSYTPINRDFFMVQFREHWFHPKFLELFSAIQNGFSIPQLILLNLLTEVSPNIYSFPCFNPVFCAQLLEECENYIQYALQNNIEVHRPNSMNRYGLILAQIGMGNLLSDLQQQYLAPISSIFYPVEASQFTSHHSFIVSYEPDRDRALDLHTDDSDVTWNICLGKEFSGSGLTFCGMMAKSDHRQYRCSYQHVLGHAVVHLGQQRHGAENITSGERHNLIIWCRNEVYRSSAAYHKRMRSYEKESNPPDIRCLSYTHDRDYILYHDNYPPGTNPFNLSDGDDEDEQQGHSHGHGQGQELPLPWCPPVKLGYDGIPTPNQLMKIIYTKLVDEEMQKNQKEKR